VHVLKHELGASRHSDLSALLYDGLSPHLKCVLGASCWLTTLLIAKYGFAMQKGSFMLPFV